MATTALMISASEADQRWQAVVNRDREADGRFVYAVRSTGIYCRPSCPSRRPHRRHVRFFDAPALALQAGFRACRRCRPDDTAPTDPGLALAQRVRTLIDQSGDRDVRLQTLSKKVGRSPHYLLRTFKRVVGMTPREYARARRVARLKHELRTGDSVSRAQFAAGYGSSSRLYEGANAQLGMTPATYQKGGIGMRIGFTVVPTTVGALLVAGTERGLCAVRFGTSRADLLRGLEEEFPAAELTPEEPRVRLWAETLRTQVEGLRPTSLVPLDVQATAFQRRVWQQLRRIPFGRTRTYSQIAAAVGNRGAVRAVARACAANPAAVAIPCHRVVRADGSLGGYRWGLDRKQALLEREAGQRKGKAS